MFEVGKTYATRSVKADGTVKRSPFHTYFLPVGDDFDAEAANEAEFFHN